MRECYYKWCEHHEQDEPYCLNNECTADAKALIVFEQLRNEELTKWKLEAN